jgi:hypothetical protein
VVESSALLKRRTPKGYRGFESLPHRQLSFAWFICRRLPVLRVRAREIRAPGKFSLDPCASFLGEWTLRQVSKASP